MTPVLEPPSIYLPYDGPGIELVLPRQRVKTICFVLGVRKYDVQGCMIWAPGGCLIVIPQVGPGVTAAEQDAVRRHENAHCNGWRH